VAIITVMVKPVVLYMCFSHGKAELIPLDKKPNDSIVHDVELGKTDGFPCQAFNTCSERKMCLMTVV